MQKKALQEFSGGMTQDKSKTADWSKNYYSANNIRIVSNEGLSTGSIETIKGTRLEFKLPTSIATASYTLNNGELETVIGNNSENIIAGLVINDDIIVISNGINDNIQNTSATSVWKCKYDVQTDKILDLKANGELDITKHLIYRRTLDMYTPHNNPKVIGRYETNEIQRIYWTDSDKQMRVINTNLPFYIDPSTGLLVNEMQKIAGNLTYLAPNVEFSIPQLAEISQGNLPKGSIQYAYRLINSEGGITRFSPQTGLIDLAKGEVSGNYNEYPLVEEDFFKGDSEEFKENKDRIKHESNKSVRIKIDNIDTKYDYVQLCYTIFRDKGQAEIFILPEQRINSNVFEYTHSGNEGTEVKITRDEFIALSNPFELSETIETKDNILFAANTTTPKFEIALDTRAYRFDKYSKARLYEKQDYSDTPLTLNGNNLPNTPVTGLNDWGIDETLNLINPFNDEAITTATTPLDWKTDCQYKYQADGKTFGGEGPNVKYRFTLNSEKAGTPEELIADNTTIVPVSKPFLSSPKHELTDVLQLEGQGTQTGNLYNIGGSFKDLKSPYKANLLTGYARGEVYRFAIVFIDNKGNESFAKWIGDIKFPEFTDLQNNYPEFDLSSFDGVNMKLYPLGIEFTVTIPEEIKEQISGFKIVRVERTDAWKTRLGTGVTGSFGTFLSGDIWEVLLANLQDCIYIAYDVILKSTYFATISGALVAGAVSNIYNTIHNTLIAEFNTRDRAKGLTHETLKRIIVNAIEAIKVPLTNSSLFSSSLAEKAADIIMEIMGDSLDFFVAGIDSKVKYLDDWYSYTNSVASEHNTTVGKPKGIAGNNIGYIISPIISFDKYEYKYNDYIKVIKEYKEGHKLVREYHVDPTTGLFVRTESRATYKKWYYGTLLNPGSDPLNKGYKRIIKEQNKMEVGEIIRSANSTSLDDFSYVNAHLGYIERYKHSYSTNIIQQAIKTLGIGDRKHFIVLQNNMPDTNENFVYQESYYNHVHTRVIDVAGNFLVSYNRDIKHQYGGNTYSERSNSVYIDCGHYIKLSNAGTFVCKIYGGDTTVALFDAVNYGYYFDKKPGYQKPKRAKKAMAEIFPCEVPFNINLRDGHHFAKSQDKDSLDEESRNSKRQRRKEAKEYKKSGILPDKIAELVGKKRFVHDQFILDDVYEQENNIRHYIPKPLINNFDKQNKTRVWKSKSKIDGELFDSWRQFPFLDFIDVEGNQGEVKDLQVLNNKLLAYQTRGICIIATNEREVTSGINGAPTTLGTVGYLSRYDYITKNTGVQFRFATCRTPNAIYHLDTFLKRIVRLADKDGLEDITFLEGMSSYLETSLSPTISIFPTGVITGYNPKLSTVYFVALSQTEPLIDGTKFFCLIYNEKTQSFESFMTKQPLVMFNDTEHLFSVGRNHPKSIWEHNKGEYGKIYNSYEDSSIKMLLNDNPLLTKEFNNLVLDTECKDTNGVELHETINKLKVSSDYLDSDEVTLIPDNNIRRKFRNWTCLIPRSNAVSAYTSFKTRMLDKNLMLTLKYTNNNNKKLIIHPIIYEYQAKDLVNNNTPN